MPLTLERPVSLEVWKRILSKMDSATTFHDFVSTFHGPQSASITDELKGILGHFGGASQTATFAVRHGIVESVWIDAFHNYIAIIFSKATGDEDDFVMINSFGR